MPSEFPVPRPQPDAPAEAWGRSNPLRGANHVDVALSFLEEFPIGTGLSPEKFDEWAQRRGLLNVPTGAPKGSDAWLAHLQRRHQLHYNINKAASHSRMASPFVVEFISPGLWEVRTPHIAISRSKILQKVESICGTQRKNLTYLMQSADWNVLPPHERAFAEALYDDIDMYQKQIELQGQSLSNKFAKLESKLRKALASGEIRPRNGGIKKLLDHTPHEEESE